HFLEDAFSVGHLTAFYDASPVRNGTHDLYSRAALDVDLWGNHAGYIANGDAFLADADELHAAAACEASLGQVLCAADVHCDEPSGRSSAQGSEAEIPPESDLDSCHVDVVRASFGTKAEISAVLEVLSLSPRPVTENPALPTHRAEIGVFFPFELT